MSNDATIAAKVAEFVGEEKGFTSVDICNSIKGDGTWIRNREVASFLRRWSPPVGYYSARVTVTLEGGGSASAAVYMPNTMTPAEYVETSQSAMTPAEFEALHGFDPTQPQRDDGVLATVVDVNDDGGDGDDGSHSATVGDRLRSLFRWAPGS